MNDNKNITSQILTEKLLNLSASLFPKLYLFELVLKNSLFDTIRQELGEKWFTQQIENKDKSSLLAEELLFISKRKKRGYKLTDQGLLKESALGFWVELFNKDAYKQHKGVPIKIFKRLPSSIKRKEIYQTIARIKDFRNQLFHTRIPLSGSKDQASFLNEYSKVNQDLELFFKWVDVPEYHNIITTDNKLQIQEIKNLIDA